MRPLLFGTTLSIIACGTAAWAQTRGGYDVWQGWGGYHHASTAAEGASRGMADFTRSAGAANLMNSEAVINMTTAASQDIKNRVDATNAYFDMRSINKEAREAERGPRPTQEDLTRYAAARAPSRLSVSELDPVSGQIDWPAALQDPAFAEGRATLEQLFAANASTGTLTLSQRTQVKQATQDMEYILKENLQAFAPQDYVNAKNFLKGLGYELYAGAG